MGLEKLVNSIDVYKVEDFIKIDNKEPVPKVPYQIPKVARSITDRIKKDRVQAFSVYDWIEENIDYEEDSNEKFREGASSIIYSFKNGVGTCYSMTHLCVSMAKSVGLDARIADVDIDCNDKEIEEPGHICTYVNLGEDYLMLDPAYKDGDVKHKKFEYYSLSKTNSELIEDVIRPYKFAFENISKDNYKDRINCCNKVLYLFPDNDFFKTRKRNILSEAGLKNVESDNFELGIICFEEILSLYPNDETAAHNLAIAKKKKDR